MAHSRHVRPFELKSTSLAGKDTASDSCVKWITRYNDISFKCNGVYHGVVETIQSKGAATVVIGEKERGIPLLWNDDWCGKGVKFAKVLLLVDRLRPSIEQAEYDKDTILRDKVKEGEVLFVVIEECKSSPDNIYKYIASSAFKIESGGKFVNESVLLNIRDPLRGIVDSHVSQNVGIVTFGTYSGNITKALFTSSCYRSPTNVNVELPLKYVAPVNTLVYLEVTKWHGNARVQEWEKLLLKDGILFKATLVWPKGTPRPSRVGGERVGSAEAPRAVHKRSERGFADHSVDDNQSHLDMGACWGPVGSHLLTDIHAYYGIIETIPSTTVAIICVAHRRSEPLSWMDNWFARDVSLERILLVSDHVRISKNAPESAKGTAIKTLLRKGEAVMVVVEPTKKSPDKCYKWFAKTCWKIANEGGTIPHIPLYSLPGHLRGEVECIVSHDMGIIHFHTHHGLAAKGFFNHDSYYKNGKKILPHIPLGSEVTKGTKVHVIVDKWYANRSSKEVELIAREKEVTYRVVEAWTIGTTRPDENCAAESMGDAVTGKKDTSRKPDRSEQYVMDRNTSTDIKRGRGRIGEKSLRQNVHGQDKRNFAGNRGGTKRGRGHGGAKSSNHKPRGDDDSRSCGDWVDLGDNLSQLSDYLGAASISTENLSTTSSGHSESKFQLKMADGLFGDEPVKRSDHSIAGRTGCSFDYSMRSNVVPIPSKSMEVPKHDVTKSGTLSSVDETWGLMQVDGDNFDFRSNSVYMYGLKLEDVPLHRLFRQGQAFKVHMEQGKIAAVEYGAPQLPTLLRKAISVYCENNSVDEDVRHKLESIMRCYGV